MLNFNPMAFMDEATAGPAQGPQADPATSDQKADRKTDQERDQQVGHGDEASPATVEEPSAPADTTPATTDPVTDPVAPPTAPAVAAADEAGTEDAYEDQLARPEPGPNYKRRQAALLLAPALLVAAAVWAFTGGPLALEKSPAVATATQAGKTTDKAMTQDATLDINTLAAGDLKKAAATLAKSGSLDGFTIKATGVRTAASGTNAVISRTHTGVCYMYAILDGTPTAVQTDATGAACTDAEIASAQKALDEQTIAVEQQAAEAAQAAFTSASDTVVYYAGKSFDTSGAPTLKGIPADLGAGVRVVANHGDYVTAQATINGACKQAELSADGTLGQIVTCR